MSDEKQESVADIVADMRRGMDKSWHDIDREWARGLADRIEAAWARDSKAIATENAVLPAVCITIRGNAAAMREACANIAEYSKTAACHTEDAHLLGYLDQIERWAKAALSEPPRNCDRFADEDDAFAAWHDSLNDGDVVSVRNAFRWLFEPAAERKGEGK